MPRHTSERAADELPRAATVVLVRDGDAGPEVLMMRRPQRGSFAGAWVFAGGKVEPGDRAADGTTASEIRNAAVREVHEETNYVVDPDMIVPISVWEPPERIPARIRTWFFVTDQFDGTAVAQPGEVEEIDWVTPAAMLARHARGEVVLYPPTFVTLDQFTGFGSAAELVAAARARGVHEFHTNLRDSAGVPVFRWHGDFEYDQDLPGQRGPRHRIVAGAVPWTYERDDTAWPG